MAGIKSSVAPVPNELFINSDGAAQVSLIQRGSPYAVAGISGTIAAALAANAYLFHMRLDPGSTVNAFIERIRLQFTTLVAFTTPITVGRRIEVIRGSGVTAVSGGTAIAAAVRKRSSQGASQFDAAEGGDMRIGATGGVALTGLSVEATPIRVMSLVHVGNAGNYLESIFEEGAPIQLEPGQSLALRIPQAMDAAGTWQLGVNVDWHEGLAL